MPAVTYGSGDATRSISVADVNGDGKPDLLVANPCSNNCNDKEGNVAILLGNGDGTFQAAVSYDSGGLTAFSVAVADVNGDGKPDLLVANYNSSSVGVLMGNGDGTFQTAVVYGSGGANAESVTVADVNRDGKLDLVVANEYSCNNCAGAVGVLLGNGDGTFRQATLFGSGGYYPYSAAVKDLNGDGKPDIAVVNDCASKNCDDGGLLVGVLLGDGDGTFQTAVPYASGGFPAGTPNANALAVADINGDGKPDLLVANACALEPGCGDGSVGVLIGNGNGTFQAAVTYDSGGMEAESVAVADINGDGKPDLVVANYCNTNNCNNGLASLLVGKGNGTFQTAVPYGSGGYYAESIVAMDLNGDGKPDLAVTNCGSACNAGAGDGTVGVLINISLDVARSWTEFHTLDMVRWNPYEHVLNIENVGRLKKRGSYTTGGPVYSSSPAIVNGVAYFGSDDNNVYAVNVHTGAKLWSYSTGGYVQSSPSVTNGVVYVGSYDKNVYALNGSTGALLWKYTTGNGVQSSPTVADGIVFVGSLDHKVYALKASTGEEVWSYTTGNVVYSSPAVADGTVYFGSYDNNVYALDANTGALRWRYTTGNEVYSSPAVANGMVYIGSYDKNVYALDATTGALQWTYATGDVVPSSPAIANGTVYVGSQDNNVYALDASTGALLWNYITNDFVFSSPAVANGVVYVGSYDNSLYALDGSTGSKLWSYSTGNAVTSSPVVVNGVVYVGSNDDMAYAFGLPRE